MEKGYIEYKGVKYSTLDIEWNKISEVDMDSDKIVTLADLSLCYALEDDYMKGDSVAVSIDDGIYFYCDYGFIDSVTDEREVIEYMK